MAIRVLTAEMPRTEEAALTVRGSGLALIDADTPSFKGSLAREF